MKYNKKVKKYKDEHICSECIGSFTGKEIFTARVPNEHYKTNYCVKCLKILKITEFVPYFKPTVKKDVVKISDVRKWLKELTKTQETKILKQHFNGKDIKELKAKELRELYTKEVINKT